MNGFTHRSTTARVLVAACAAFLASACETVPDKDYSAFRAAMPRSILVLPPVNESVDVEATYSYLTVASEAIGERGYYVFPVGVVDAFMRENGLPGPEEMHAVPLDRIDEIIGADAVLYITLEEFGQKFELLRSTTRVDARAELVDVGSGATLWTNEVNYAVGNSSTGGGLLADVVAAAITQAGNTVNDVVHDGARVAHSRLVTVPGQGLLYGPRHPAFGTEELADGGEGAPAADVPSDENDVPGDDVPAEPEPGVDAPS